MSGSFRVALALGLAIVILSATWMGAAAALRSSPSERVAAAGSVEWLNVSVSDQLAFALSTDQVAPGALVHVVVTQLGSSEHTFTLSPTAGYQFPQGDLSPDLQAYFARHPPLVNVNVSGTAASTGLRFYGNFTAPPLGQYEYVCTKPGHFPRMSGILGSGESGGALTVNTGPGAPVFIIVGTIIALVIIALVLGFVVGRRHGSEEEMPPERLGYPERSGPGEPRV